MLSKVASGAVQGIQGYEVSLEVHLGHGMVGWHMVGLPEGAVREAKVRVKSALCEGGFDWPQRPISVNLAPANIRKEGTAFDLPMAAAMLSVDKRIPCENGCALSSAMVVGELGFSGEVRAIRGALPLAIAAKEAGFTQLILPLANAPEAAIVEGIDVLPVAHLQELVDHAQGKRVITPFKRAPMVSSGSIGGPDMRDVKGQRHARRAMEIAATGGHNILLSGPPGSGKSMLARRLSGILPALSFEEALEVTTIYSVAGLLPKGGLVQRRPFRAPHHTISDVGLIGGGARVPRPGEVTLAHHGVLFLDELPEFRKRVLEVLRQPLEENSVTLTRNMMTVTYPAQVMLVAAMNACPCGYLGSRKRSCRCHPGQVERYRGRISGPLLDRIDLQVEVHDIDYRELRSEHLEESSEVIRQRVEAARGRQRQRLLGTGIYCNAQLRPEDMKAHCSVNEAGHLLLERAVDHLGMSARAYDRILKVARTIADLEEVENIQARHLAEAISYRGMDRNKLST